MITHGLPFIFAYGSLLTGTGNRRFDAWLSRASYSYSAGFIHARLYNLGAYPAAVASSGKDEKVYGTVLRLRRPDALDRLDRYELYRPDAHHHSEFLRRLTQVTLIPNRHAFTCWVYFYNGPLKGRPRIRHGDYAAHLATGRR